MIGWLQTKLRKLAATLRLSKRTHPAALLTASEAPAPPSEPPALPATRVIHADSAVSSAAARSASGLRHSPVSRKLVSRLGDKASLREAIMLREILGPPVALRSRARGRR